MRWAFLILPVLILNLFSGACGAGSTTESGGTDSREAYQCPMPAGTPAPVRDASDIRQLIIDNNLWDISKGPFYSVGHPFYEAIVANPPVHADSAAMIQTIADEDQAGGGFFISVTEYTTPVFFVDSENDNPEDFSVVDVELTADWACKKRLLNVPIPKWARPDPSDDGHMVVVDIARREVFDFWRACFDGSVWRSGWANHISLDSDGIYPSGGAATGSGLSTMLGIIWPHELEAGVIEHALVLSPESIRSGIAVGPATESDGFLAGSRYVPEGARLRLKPEVDIDAYSGLEKMVARALRDYGFYVIDSGGGIELQAVHPFSFSQDPYTGDLGFTYTEYGTLELDLNIHDFEVLDWGQTEKPAQPDTCPSDDPWFE